MAGITLPFSSAVANKEDLAETVPAHWRSSPPPFKTSSRGGAWLALCLQPRPEGGFGWPETGALLCFCALLFPAIAHHESWFDEAQAWLLARDCSLRDLFVHRLHYEGAPGLWHALLWCEAHCHLTFFAMRCIAGGFAALGITVWLRFNPLPRLLSLLMPFTYFFLFQYAVVARSYTLAPLFAFWLLHLYSRRSSSPVLFAVVAGLFANCSLHMAAFAVGLTLLYAQDRLKPRGATPGLRLRQLSLPALVLALFLVGAVLTAVPTADGSSTTANPIVSSLRALGPHAQKVTTLSTLPTGIPTGIQERSLTPPPQGRLATALWNRIHVDSAAPPQVKLKAAVVKHLVVLLTAITGPIATSNLLALAFVGLVIWNLASARLWLALAPYALVQMCNILISGEAHHIGLTWVALVGVLWVVSLQAAETKGRLKLTTPLLLLFALTLVVEVLQVDWSTHALYADLTGPYSGHLALANFLQQLAPDQRVANFDQGPDAVNAYLAHRPYFNTNTAYWPFSRTRDPDLRFAETMATHPDRVVITLSLVEAPVMNQWVTLMPQGTVLTYPARMAYLKTHGYHESNRFCGTRVFRDAAESLDCDVVFALDRAALP